MIEHIDFSPGQIKILKRVFEIYNNSLSKVYGKFSTNEFDPSLQELMEMININKNTLMKTVEDDFIMFQELMENIQLFNKLSPLELSIVGFIIQNWTEDEGWSDLEAFNLLQKIQIMITFLNNNPKSILS